MKPEAMLKELETAANGIAVKVSYEALKTNVGPGGLCRVNGNYRVIIDKRTSARERLAILAQAISSFDTAKLDVSKPLREVINFYDMRPAAERA